MGSSLTMSPDTVSSLFPNRPIRPMPKRRLREKLSPDFAHTIKYPPSTHDAPPLFQYPSYSPRNDNDPQWSEDAGLTMRRVEMNRNYTPRPQGTGSVEGSTPRSALIARSTPEILTRGTHLAAASGRLDGRSLPHSQAPPSTASSVDGYDSFENSNNKKKRKIPSAGDLSHNGPHGLSSDISSLSISANGTQPRTETARDKYYPGYSQPGSHASTSPGMSGPGRGRLGRSLNGRSPLRSLPDGSNLWSSRSSRGGATISYEKEGPGIITNAIANAEKHPSAGQENISLLQQYSANQKATPASTQFTFTCDSQVPGTIQWPGPPNRQHMGTQANGTGARRGSTSYANTQEGSAQHDQRGAGNSRRRERRRLEKELDMAARQRRQATAETNYHNPPRVDEVWVCEFCEYERIFGEPPRTLIRDYELKERRIRHEMAERKRMVEKAKAKARKNKKNAKAPTKGAQAAGQTHETLADEAVDEVETPQHTYPSGHSTQSEEDYEDNIVEDHHQASVHPLANPVGTAVEDPDGRRVPLPPWPEPES